MKGSADRDKSRRQFLKSTVLGSVGLAAAGSNGLTSIGNAQKPVLLVNKGESQHSICVSETAI